MIFKKSVLILVFLCLCTSLYAQQTYRLASPDGRINVEVAVQNGVRYSVVVDGKQLIEPSGLALNTDQTTSGSWTVASDTKSRESEVLKPAVWQKSSTIDNTYRQLTLQFENNLSLQWRAYNNGVAWRWRSELKGPYKVTGETANFAIAGEGKTWYPEEESFYSHNERLYKEYALDSVTTDQLASLPVLVETKGTKILITESSLFDYAGLWVRGTGEGGLQSVHPHYPLKTEKTSDRDERVRVRADFIAKTEGARSFPWRVLMIARNDKELLNNQMVYKLAKPATGDYSWVEPGKVAWDWWNANNVYNVDFKAGINTQTYKYYIDFAAEYGLEYLILDEGWSDTENLLKPNPEVDMEALTAYARKKGVGLILWTTWLSLREQMQPALDQFEEWGIKGIKVDFMQRDDQKMVQYYERVAKEAAERKLLVDFHGAYKPTGWLRTFPNVLTSEGVKGNEVNKWADSITPEHTATLPFIRMAAGPMDFTPGGMRNAHKKNWAAVSTEPMTMGTRANQLAMYVVYESPLQMLCDTPTHYYDVPQAMDFLESVPVEWADTAPLTSKVGDYVMMARKAPNGDWYLGVMTDHTARKLTAELSFLKEGKTYEMKIWKDGINADRNAKDLKVETLQVQKGMEIPIKMVRGGGWVARISPTRK